MSDYSLMKQGDNLLVCENGDRFMSELLNPCKVDVNIVYVSFFIVLWGWKNQFTLIPSNQPTEEILSRKFTFSIDSNYNSVQHCEIP